MSSIKEEKLYMTGDKARIDGPVREAPLPTGTAPESPPRFSIRKIVVPTDLKPNGQKAIRYALAMAQSFDATLTLVHIYDPAYTYAEAQEVVGTLERMCLQLKKEHAASEFTIDVGVPYLRIPEIARNLQADLLVIAKHNYSWLERFMFGGDAERIVRRTVCPILIVDDIEEDTAQGGG
jgi:nucleotide-binding universal stress UspA family protein